MNKGLKKLSVLVFTCVLFLTSFSSFANASSLTNTEAIQDKQIAELAYMFEFIFEEAAIKDELGNIIDLDINMIEEEFGTSPELEQLKEQREAFIKLNEQKEEIKKECQNQLIITPYYEYDPVDMCVSERLTDEYGDIISGAVFGAIFAELWNNNWQKAAELAIKSGVKGSVVGIGYNLSVIFFSCLWEYGDNPW